MNLTVEQEVRTWEQAPLLLFDSRHVNNNIQLICTFPCLVTVSAPSIIQFILIAFLSLAEGWESDEDGKEKKTEAPAATWGEKET